MKYNLNCTNPMFCCPYTSLMRIDPNPFPIKGRFHVFPLAIIILFIIIYYQAAIPALVY